MLNEDAIEVVKHFDLLVDYEDAIRFVMDYVDENDYMINCAYDAIGRDEMKRFFLFGFYSNHICSHPSCRRTISKTP